MELTARYIKAITTRPNHNDPTQVWGVFIFAPIDGRTTFSAVGILPKSAQAYDLEITLVGEWQRNPYKSGGKQFKFDHCSVPRPAGKTGTVAFLMQAPMIGSIKAAALWDLYDEKAIDQCINAPAEVTEKLRQKLNGISKDLITNAGRYYAEAEAQTRHLCPLTTLLHGLRFPKTTIPWAAKKLGGDPVGSLSANPFLLMKAPGVGFTLCDGLRANLKLPANMPERYQAAMTHVFESFDNQGETWLPKRQCIQQLTQLTDSTQKDSVAAIVKLLEAGTITAYQGHLSLTREARTEYDVCQEILRLRSFSHPWPKISADIALSGHQLEQLYFSQQNGCFTVLLGSAGTGKTTVAAAVVKSFKGKRVIACAPTGKAAQRLTAGFANIGVNLQAETIHRVLGATPTASGWEFKTDELPCDLLVVDEFGMATDYLAKKLFQAVKSGTYVLCLGDPHQLPPIGRGTLLRDLRAQVDEFMVGELTEVHRNAGDLERICSEICHGNAVRIPPLVENMFHIDNNLRLIRSTSDSESFNYLTKLITNIRDGNLRWLDAEYIDPIKEVQIVVPHNDASEVARTHLNPIIQDIVNPTQSAHPYYRPYDRVICLKNGQYPQPNSERTQYVANGEIGYVTDVRNNTVLIRMALTGQVVRYFTKGQGFQFDLAYAVTCHKMQGDQAPLVITILSQGYGMICREWLVTALTRAQSQAIVIGNQDQITSAVNNVIIWRRKSFKSDWFTSKEFPQWKPNTPPSQ